MTGEKQVERKADSAPCDSAEQAAEEPGWQTNQAAFSQSVGRSVSRSVG